MSAVTVLSAEVLCEVTASPARRVPVSGMVRAGGAGHQPSTSHRLLEVYAVNVVPERVTRTYTGALPVGDHVAGAHRQRHPSIAR